jgi:hypothetical protein
MRPLDDPLTIPNFLRRNTTQEPIMKPHDDTPEPQQEKEHTEDLTKEQLEDMAATFSQHIAKLDQRITKDGAERAEYRKKLRAIEGKLVTIAIRNRQAGG